MRLFHATTEAAAAGILREGFRDATGNYLTLQKHTGVWFSDRPLEAQDIGSYVDVPAVLAIEIDGRTIRRYEWIDDANGYREWLIPADVVNRYRCRSLGKCNL